jgi:hypothetical protein
MAVKGLPKTVTTPAPAAKDREIETFIRRGGSTASDAPPDVKTKSVLLNVPHDVLADIDRLRADRRLKTPRHTWIMEAIIEKLDRERGSE